MYRQFVRLCSSFRHLFHTLWSRIRHSHPLGGGCMLDSAEGIFRINRVGFDVPKMAREIELVSSLTRTSCWIWNVVRCELANPSSSGVWFSGPRFPAFATPGTFLMLLGHAGRAFMNEVSIL